MQAWYDFCFPGIPVVTPMFPSPSSPAVNPWLTAWCRAMTTTLSGSINTSAMSQVGGALMRFHWIIKVWKDISFQSIWFNLNSNCPYACPHFHTIVNSIQKVNWQKFRDQFDSFLLMLRMSLQCTSNDSNKHVVSFNSLLYCQNLMYEVWLISEKPHNPMINSGAIIVSSLLKPELALPDRFDWVISLLYFKLTFICDNLPLHFSYDKWNLRN